MALRSHETPQLLALARDAVLPVRVVSGLASAHGPLGCVAQTTLVYVNGRQIKSATFYLDGHKVKTVTKADKKGRYSVKINPRKLKFGVHRVKVVVVFTASSETKSTTLRVIIARCRPPLPKFTG